jgi:hypothetical protein
MMMDSFNLNHTSRIQKFIKVCNEIIPFMFSNFL